MTATSTNRSTGRHAGPDAGQDAGRAVGDYADGRHYELPPAWQRVNARVLEVALARTQAALDEGARGRLATYYNPEGEFAGTLMSSLDPNPEDELCPADLLAVSMLSITIPQLTARRLLDPGEPRRVAHRLLRAIPYGLPITALDVVQPCSKHRGACEQALNGTEEARPRW